MIVLKWIVVLLYSAGVIYSIKESAYQYIKNKDEDRGFLYILQGVYFAVFVYLFGWGIN